VRFLGTFLARPADVPDVVARRVAEELGVADPGRLADYARREPTHREHASEIQREYGYRDLSDLTARADLRGWLEARAWATAERPSVLFDLATARLIEAKVLLPGASVLARAVASARDRAAARLHRTMAEAASDERRQRLDELLEVAVGEHKDRRYASCPTWTAPPVACVPRCSCCSTRRRAGSRSCGAQSAATSAAQS